MAQVCDESVDLLGHHHLDELLVVDLAVAVHIRLADHLVHLLVRQLLPQVAGEEGWG